VLADAGLGDAMQLAPRRPAKAVNIITASHQDPGWRRRAGT